MNTASCFHCKETNNHRVDYNAYFLHSNGHLFFHLPSLTGEESVVCGGSSIGCVSKGRVLFSEGTVFDVEISTGSTYPVCEGVGFTAYDTSGNGVHAEIMMNTKSKYSYHIADYQWVRKTASYCLFCGDRKIKNE